MAVNKWVKQTKGGDPELPEGVSIKTPVFYK
jgi:hypothetical protein